jgi:hypothetical protein
VRDRLPIASNIIAGLHDFWPDDFILTFLRKTRSDNAQSAGRSKGEDV